jgi:hypothetical protein
MMKVSYEKNIDACRKEQDEVSGKNSESSGKERRQVSSA